MFGFHTKPIVDDHQMEWQLQTYRWLLRNYGRRFTNGTYRLVKPTKAYFPEDCSSEADVVHNTFLRVKQYAGLLDWPCRLKPQAEDETSIVAPTLVIRGAPQGPAGTFRYQSSGGAEITYNPGLVNDPQGLVSTYAHELGHYLTANCTEAPPGGWELWEPATDLTAVYMGFGIFMANSAFVFKQFTSFDSQGWSTERRGYLSPLELVNALAIFILLKDINEKEALVHLRPGLRRPLKQAVKYFRGSSIISELKPKVAKLELVNANARFTQS